MSKHKFRSSEERATLRSVLIGVGGVLAVTVAVALFNPKMMRRPPPPPTPTLVQGLVVPVPSAPATPLDHAAPAPQQAAALESPPAAPGSQAFVSPAEPNAVADVQTPPSGEVAELPRPAPLARPVHAVRPLKKGVAHHVRPVHAAPPAGAGPELPAAAVQPPPVVQAPDVFVGGRRQAQDVPSRRVSLADLDLATDVGACKALSRIKRAAEQVCPYEGDRNLGFQRVHRMCTQDSVSRAVQDMNVRRVEVLLGKGSGGC